MASSDKVSSLHDQIANLSNSIQSLSAELANNEEARKKLLVASQDLVARLETPVETIWRIIMQVSP